VLIVDARLYKSMPCICLTDASSESKGVEWVFVVESAPVLGRGPSVLVPHRRSGVCQSQRQHHDRGHPVHRQFDRRYMSTVVEAVVISPDSTCL
jgi:hypothetical protein